MVHQRLRAGVQRRLCQLDRAHVVLSDPDLGLAGVQQIGRCGRRAGRGGCAAVASVVPSLLRMPARNIASASMMPEPQIPEALVRRVASAKPGSSDQRSQPITLKRGSRVAGSMRTRSIAPGAAMAAADLRALERRPGRRRRREQTLAVAEHDLGVGADVHDQREVVREVRRLGQDDAGRYRRRRGRRCTAARRPGRWDAPPGGRARSPTGSSPGRWRARTARRGSVGSMPSSRWCMIGLPTKVSSRMSRGSTAPARRPARSAHRSPRAPRGSSRFRRRGSS